MKKHFLSLFCMLSFCLLTASMCSDNDDEKLPEYVEVSAGTSGELQAKYFCKSFGESVDSFENVLPLDTIPYMFEDSLSLIGDIQCNYMISDSAVFKYVPATEFSAKVIYDTIYNDVDADCFTFLSSVNGSTYNKDYGSKRMHGYSWSYYIGGQQFNFRCNTEELTFAVSEYKKVLLPYIEFCDPEVSIELDELSSDRVVEGKKVYNKVLYRVNANILLPAVYKNIAEEYTDTLHLRALYYAILHDYNNVNISD